MKEKWILGAPWEKIADTAIAVVDKKIYMIGGVKDASTVMDTVYIYDTETGTWSRGQDMTSPRIHCTTVAVGKDIYCIGGFNKRTNGTEALKTVEIYDTVTDSWRVGTPRNIALSNALSIYANDKIYCCGGIPQLNASISDRTEIYDLNTGQWYEGPRLKTPMYKTDHGETILDGKAYFVGGRIENSSGQRVVDSTIHIFDIDTETWDSMENPYAPCSTTSVVFNNKIYCVGGTIDTSKPVRSSRLLIYNPANGQWDEGLSMPIAAHTMAASVGNKIYSVVNSIYGGTSTGDVYIYTHTAEITRRYETVEGTAIQAEEIDDVDLGADYTASAASLAGYRYLGYRMDGGPLIADRNVNLYDVQEDHVITFVYTEDENGPNPPTGSNCTCHHKCCMPYIHIPLCSCNSRLAESVIEHVQKQGHCCEHYEDRTDIK